MGISMGKFINTLAGVHDEVRILMVGLEEAGKTTILYKFKIGEVKTEIPTIGFTVETVEHEQKTFKLKINAWDVGGQDKEKLRPLWRTYYKNTKAVAFVVDSNDHDRMEDAKAEIRKMMDDDDLSGALLLIYANKQDLPNAINSAELPEKLGLHDLKNVNWYIQSACATTGEGLDEGMQWISMALHNQKH